MPTSLQINLVLILLLLISLVGGYTLYLDKELEINKLETEVTTQAGKIQSLEITTSTLNKNILIINDTLDLYKVNQAKSVQDTKKLQASVSRLDVIKAKPGLVSIKIEKAYKDFHLEKACISHNKEACDALNTK